MGDSNTRCTNRSRLQRTSFPNLGLLGDYIFLYDKEKELELQTEEDELWFGWSQLADIKTPPIVTSDFVYVRLIGDRSIQEKDFGRIQIDRIKEMKKVVCNFKKDSDESNLSGVRFSIVAANNHYAGFGPGTVNIFRQLLGIEELKWGEETILPNDFEKEEDSKKRVIKTKQTSLSDFLQ